MSILTKDELLSLAGDLKFEDVPVPELKEGGVVRVRELSGNDRDALEDLIGLKPDGSINLQALRSKTLSLAIVDENGDRLFTPEEIEELGKLSGKVIVRLYARVSELSGLGRSEMEKILKNSKPQAQSEDSSSDSL